MTLVPVEIIMKYNSMILVPVGIIMKYNSGHGTSMIL